MLNRPQFLIAYDHLLLAELCKRCLEVEFEVVGIVGNGRELVSIAPRVKPDVVVLDISMPILNGLDAGDQVKRLLPTVKLIYLTMSSDPQLAAEALSRGALGYLVKPAPALNCWSLCAVFFEASLISLPTCAKMRSMRFVGRRKA